MFDGESGPGRQFGNCSEAYANYAIERLEVCVLTVSHLRDHFETQGISQTVSHRSLESLQECVGCRAYGHHYREWQEYLDVQERISE